MSPFQTLITLNKERTCWQTLNLFYLILLILFYSNIPIFAAASILQKKLLIPPLGISSPFLINNKINNQNMEEKEGRKTVFHKE